MWRSELPMHTLDTLEMYLLKHCRQGGGGLIYRINALADTTELQENVILTNAVTLYEKTLCCLGIIASMTFLATFLSKTIYIEDMISAFK